MVRKPSAKVNSRRCRQALPARRVPVAAEADVVVTGGGPGGFAAALQARRMGASVVLIEKYDMPGGVHTSGLQGAASQGAGGIHTELMEKFDAAGLIYTATEKTHPGWAGNPLSHYEARLKPGSDFIRQSFNPEGAGCVMAEMLAEVGVETLFGSAFVDATVKAGSGNDRITSVIIENASGRQAVRGKIFIDGTGTAELVAKSGAPFVRGGGPQPQGADWDGQNRPVPGGLLWIMSGIDLTRLTNYQQSTNDPMLSQLIKEASAAGDIPDGLYRPRMGGTGVYGNAYIGHPTLDMSPIQADGPFIIWQNVPDEWDVHMDDDGAHEARAKSTLRQFIRAEAAFLHKYVPGFGNAFMGNVGRYVGIRDGRHPIGEYVFSLADVLAGRHFADGVTKPMRRTFFWDNYREHEFQVPYRCFLPKKINNLLLTGASLSFTYDTIFMVMRSFPWTTQTGEIAGYAAALSVRKGISPKDLDWKEPYF
ncbi:MAG: FAD-dependent oxidoreductase [Rhodospirillales bacterium]|nr:FAD-dependent oxidoreductase [Rhodospirillales bacterium]